MQYLYSLILIFLVFNVPINVAKKDKNVVETVEDFKEFKKTIRTKTNVLVCFTSKTRESAGILKVFNKAAQVVKGQGTMILIDCSSGEGKKLCKKLKVNPEPYVLKHYHNGEFNKDYDRKSTVSSMVNFMRDPTGDLPWEEDASSNGIVHISDLDALAKFIKQEIKPVMVMFYTPWCGFCKSLKPEYVAAASELKNHSVLAAIDVNKPENAAVRTEYNITGFPTLLYFRNGELKYRYEGDNNKEGLVAFMKNPTKPIASKKELDWSETDSEIVHLTTTSFDPVIKEEASVLIMFYAPWCGHCKTMKPEFERAASRLKNEGIPGMMAAVDATKENSLAKRFGVKGYPTTKYFQYGEEKFDVNFRTAGSIVEFMKNPKKPPPPPPPEKPWSEEESDVVHLNDGNFKSFLKKKKHALVMFYAPWCGHCKKTKPEFTEAAEYFKDDSKVEFAAVDCTIHQTLCALYEVTGYPTIKYFSFLNKIVKTYDNVERTARDFISFMSNSEEPQINGKDNSAVLHLTDLNFKQETRDKGAVLVMFHAPWCQQCKEAKVELYKAAPILTDVKLGVLDSSTNTQVTKEYEISAFPTFKLFFNGKYVKDYSGKITQTEIGEFVKKITTARKEEL